MVTYRATGAWQVKAVNAELTGSGRLEIGNGRFAKRGLFAVMPTVDEFPYIIRAVPEITESSDETDTSINLDDDGNVKIRNDNIKAAKTGVKRVMENTAEIEVGVIC